MSSSTSEPEAAAVSGPSASPSPSPTRASVALLEHVRYVFEQSIAPELRLGSITFGQLSHLCTLHDESFNVCFPGTTMLHWVREQHVECGECHAEIVFEENAVVTKPRRHGNRSNMGRWMDAAD